MAASNPDVFSAKEPSSDLFLAAEHKLDSPTTRDDSKSKTSSEQNAASSNDVPEIAYLKGRTLHVITVAFVIPFNLHPSFFSLADALLQSVYVVIPYKS